MEDNKITNGYNNGNEERCYGLGEVLGRILKFIVRLIKKGNANYLMITKDRKKPIKLPITICVILYVVAFIPMIILTIAGLFSDYNYTVVGPDIKSHSANEAFGKAADSARNMKNDFKNGYKNS